jgi:hypothetical protein
MQPPVKIIVEYNYLLSLICDCAGHDAEEEFPDYRCRELSSDVSASLIQSFITIEIFNT